MSFTIVDTLRWPLLPRRAESGGGAWAVEVEELANGVPATNLVQSDELGLWLVRTELLRAVELEQLRDFIRITRGPWRGFRFRDPVDYQTCSLLGTPAATDQPCTPAAANGALTVFRLLCNRIIQGHAYSRRVWRPRPETFLLALDGVAVDPADYTLDAATGTVTFDSPPASGAVTWGGQFDKAARLTAMSFSLSFTGPTTGRAEPVEIREVRETVA